MLLLASGLPPWCEVIKVMLRNPHFEAKEGAFQN
jgi:hypothetical protein